MDREKFKNKVADLADEAVSKVDMDKVSESISRTIGTAIESACLVSMGFQKDSYGSSRWKLANGQGDSFFRSQLGLEVAKLAKEKAAEMMEGIDFSSIELTEADKKSLIGVYTKKRKELLDQHVRELAFEDVFKITEEVMKEVKQSMMDSTAPSSKKKDKLIDLVFSQQISPATKEELEPVGCLDDEEDDVWDDDEFGI